MASLWDGNGNIIRGDGVRTGDDVWAQALAADEDVNAADHDTHDEGLADSIEKCLNRDGENAMADALDMGSNKIHSLQAGTNRDHVPRIEQVVDGRHIWGGTAGGTANALTLTLSPGLTSYGSGGLRVEFVANADTSDPAGASLNINSVGAESLVYPDGNVMVPGSLKSGTKYTAVWDGTNFVVDAERTIVRAVTATTSGATVALSGIPANAKRVTLTWEDISGDGSDELQVAIGDAGGLETSGYDKGGLAQVTGSNTCAVDPGAADAFTIGIGGAAGASFHGTLILTLMDPASNKWVSSLNAARNNLGISLYGTQTKALSAALSQLQLQWEGSDEFDAGAVGLLIEI